jgi:hypothetical protein
MAPFGDDDDWHLAKWLLKNVTQAATEEFLKMKGVRHNLLRYGIFFSLTHRPDSHPLLPKLQNQLYISKESRSATDRA